MANASFSDKTRDSLRTAVAAVEHQIAQLPGTPGEPASQELRAAWLGLVTVLALGPAPETRVCPVCTGVGMRAASRCGNCWAKLEPLAATGHHVARTDA